MYSARRFGHRVTRASGTSGGTGGSNASECTTRRRASGEYTTGEYTSSDGGDGQHHASPSGTGGRSCDSAADCAAAGTIAR